MRLKEKRSRVKWLARGIQVQQDHALQVLVAADSDRLAVQSSRELLASRLSAQAYPHSSADSSEIGLYAGNGMQRLSQREQMIIILVALRHMRNGLSASTALGCGLQKRLYRNMVASLAPFAGSSRPLAAAFRMGTPGHTGS